MRRSSGRGALGGSTKDGRGADLWTRSPWRTPDDNSANAENPLQGKLDEPWIPCGQDFPERSPRGQTVLRVPEIDVVEQIEVLVSELDFAPGFRNGEVLKDREVVVNDPWPPNRVSAHITERAIGRHTESTDIEVLLDEVAVRPAIVE